MIFLDYREGELSASIPGRPDKPRAVDEECDMIGMGLMHVQNLGTFSNRRRGKRDPIKTKWRHSPQKRIRNQVLIRQTHGNV
jgi:hypothetical protein